MTILPEDIIEISLVTEPSDALREALSLSLSVLFMNMNIENIRTIKLDELLNDTYPIDDDSDVE